QHLQERYRELLQAGCDPTEAERRVLAEAEDTQLPTRLQPLRQARADGLATGAPDRAWWQDLWHDLRLAWRQLRSHPSFASVAILTLALGIGANAAIFALVDATLLRDLPLPQPERLLFLNETGPGGARSPVSPPNMDDWARQSQTIAAIGGYQPNVASMVMTHPDGTGENIARQWVSAGLFDALGLPALVGRMLTASDDRPDNNLVVLSEGFWRTQFHADPGIVGQALTLDGEPYTVVGVAPQAADIIGRSSIWALTSFADAPPGMRAARFFSVIARLQPNVDRAAAADDLDRIAADLAREYPQTNEGRGIAATPLQQVLVGGDLRLTAWLFLAVVALVLLVCCANVANLLLARGSVRSRELAIRAALGATRGRMLRQLLTESLLLAFLGAGAGLLLGWLILLLAPSLLPARLLPAAVTLSFDLRVVGFCLVAALLTGLLFGLAPAWQASRSSPVQAIGSDSRSSVATRGGRLRGVLVVGQIAVAVVLLFGAGLLLRTLLALGQVDPGYRAHGVLTMMVDPLGSRYPTAADLQRFYEDVAREVRDTPGIREAAWATTLPLGASSYGDALVRPETASASDPSSRQSVDYQIISERYFDVVEVPLLAGRAFDTRDSADSVPVAIVNEALARQQLAAGEPLARLLGRRLAVQTSSDPEAPSTLREIVGIAAQVKARPDETEGYAQLYVPLPQQPIGDIFLLAAPQAGDGAQLATRVRAAIHRVDTEQLVSLREVSTLDEIAQQATARQRFRAQLVAVFAGLVLTLATIGVFGLLSYTVQQRHRDLGLRMALGASRRDVLLLLLDSVGRLIGVGAVIGIGLALLLGPALASVLFGVRPYDPLTLLLVALLLGAAAALATFAPAWRAMRIDPAVTLRGD
ncbi:MAG: ABC transporter permease, partial [Xanthomonadales bacterium]|nr:ABC transporter permease [Xanthomonadales bacterium]